MCIGTRLEYNLVTWERPEIHFKKTQKVNVYILYVHLFIQQNIYSWVTNDLYTFRQPYNLPGFFSCQFSCLQLFYPLYSSPYCAIKTHLIRAFKQEIQHSSISGPSKSLWNPQFNCYVRSFLFCGPLCFRSVVNNLMGCETKTTGGVTLICSFIERETSLIVVTSLLTHNRFICLVSVIKI